MEPEKFNEDIVLRLNILINLLLDSAPTESALSTAAKVDKLTELGIPPADIARILGKPLNHVTSIIAKRKARKGKAND